MTKKRSAQELDHFERDALPKNQAPEQIYPKELERFERAKAELERLNYENQDLFDMVEAAIEEYNDALEQAGQAVRGRGVSIGDFKISREFDEFDAEKLFELVGRDKFLEWGGSERVERKLSIDKVKFRSFVSAGKIPSAVVDQIRTRQKQYSTPKPLKLR